MKATPLLHAAEVRRLEELAEAEFGLSPYCMMQRAAAAALYQCRRHYPRAAHLHVVCGPGNNGGDGVELARQARAAGMSAAVVSTVDLSASRGAAGLAWHAYRRDGGAIDRLELGNVHRHDVIVDALFGTGLSRTVTGAAATLIAAINGAAAPCVALDIPSGINADTGACLGTAVRAHHTVTFIAPKCGLAIGDGPLHTGRVHLATLDLPRRVIAAGAAALHLLAHPQWSLRRRRSHKGEHGRVMIVGGSVGMQGAASLAAKAALASGAGLVTVARPEVEGHGGSRRPMDELMEVSFQSADALLTRLEATTAIAIGPGLGDSVLARTTFDTLCESNTALVVDADGLRLLAAAPRRMTGHILTPHPGEAGALLGVNAATVENDRPAALAELVRRYDATVVLKGFRTLVGAPDAVPRCVPFGNPGLATGGSGDVLAGIITALRADYDAFDAASRGAVTHALAADRAARAGERGLLPSDVIEALIACVN
ncbi:MAG: NAD(P)H-hydrate dehydratase [Pseudomonadota bacterium]